MIARVQQLLLRLSLHRRIAVFISGVLVAVFVAFGYLSWEAVNRSTNDTLQERRALAFVVAAHLDDLVGHATTHLVIAARDLAQHGDDLGHENLELTVERALNQQRFFFSRLLVFDRSVQLQATSPPGAIPKLDAAARGLVESVIQSGQPGVSNLLRLPSTESVGVL
ncbi:MAG: hypothetical protein HY329_14320, partial [Chloroflexi bacterium]|nr:hypothetical protein [Chloroflexota bacterium]